jgi:hypothetical protein
MFVDFPLIAESTCYSPPPAPSTSSTFTGRRAIASASARARSASRRPHRCYLQPSRTVATFMHQFVDTSSGNTTRHASLSPPSRSAIMRNRLELMRCPNGVVARKSRNHVHSSAAPARRPICSPGPGSPAPSLRRRPPTSLMSLASGADLDRRRTVLRQVPGTENLRLSAPRNALGAAAVAVRGHLRFRSNFPPAGDFESEGPALRVF